MILSNNFIMCNNRPNSVFLLSSNNLRVIRAIKEIIIKRIIAYHRIYRGKKISHDFSTGRHFWLCLTRNDVVPYLHAGSRNPTVSLLLLGFYPWHDCPPPTKFTAAQTISRLTQILILIFFKNATYSMRYGFGPFLSHFSAAWISMFLTVSLSSSQKSSMIHYSRQRNI